MATYIIVRKYIDHDDETIKTGLSLDEAQAHCRDPETSSKTCTNRAGKALTEKYGPWFDTYYQEL
jgi:hypothetical protein